MRGGVRAAIAALIVLVAGAAVGCSSESDEPTSTVTVTEEIARGATGETGAPAAAARPARPDPPTPAERAEAVVESYYEAVDVRRFGEAWNLLTSGLQAELGGYDAWRDGYANTVKTKATDVRATNVSADGAVVALKIKATDRDACGDSVNQTFAGAWTLERDREEFLGSAFDVAKTGGGTPVTDASSCSGGSAPVPAIGGGCDPNYTGCVPPYPPDVDCIDVRQEVEVIGDDVHSLDLEGDGEACEVFLR